MAENAENQLKFVNCRPGVRVIHSVWGRKSRSECEAE